CARFGYDGPWFAYW
nr:immunoglobulin heavy chain junction region [Mus musculus]